MTYLHEAHRIAHDPKHGGCEGLEPQIGMSPAVLRNKVNIHNTNNHLRLDEAFQIMSATNDHGIIKAMATQLGGVFVKLPDTAGEHEAATLELLTDVFMCATAKQGYACADFYARKADGELCRNDIKALKASASDAIAELQKFIQLLGE